MPVLETINRAFRDFVRFTGDGKPNAPVGAPLPIGDPRSGRHNPPLAEIRAALIEVAQTQGDPEALSEIFDQLSGKADAANSGKQFSSRDEAVAFGQGRLPSNLRQIMTREGAVIAARSPTANDDDPLFPTSPYWGVVQRFASVALIRDNGVLGLVGITGGPNAIVAALSDDAVQARISVTGSTTVEIVPTQANTGPATLTITGDVNRRITREDGTELPPGFLVPGRFYQLRRRGDTWRVYSGAATSIEVDQLNREIADPLKRNTLFSTSRPGDAPWLFTSRLDLEPYAPQALAGVGSVTPSGAVRRLTGAGIVASRSLYSVEGDRVYNARFAMSRRVNSADPSNDAVSLSVAWYDRFGQALIDVASLSVRVFTDLKTSDGRQEVFASLSKAGQELTIPAAAVYARPFIQTYGSSCQTDIEVIEWVDVSDASIWAPDVGEFSSRLAAVESIGAGGRIERLESVVDSPIQARYLSEEAARASAVLPSIEAVEIVNTDGPSRVYKRVASEPLHRGKFRSLDGAWWELSHSGIKLSSFSGDIAEAHSFASGVPVDYENRDWPGDPSTGFLNPYGSTKYRKAKNSRKQAGTRENPTDDPTPIEVSIKFTCANRDSDPTAWDNGPKIYGLIKVAGDAYGAGLTSFARHDGGTGDMIGHHARGIGTHRRAKTWGSWTVAIAQNRDNRQEDLIGHEVNPVNLWAGPLPFAPNSALDEGEYRGVVVATVDGGGRINAAFDVSAHVGTGGFNFGYQIKPNAIEGDTVSGGKTAGLRMYGRTNADNGRPSGVVLLGSYFRTALDVRDVLQPFTDNRAIALRPNDRITFDPQVEGATSRYITVFADDNALTLGNLNLKIGASQVLGPRRTGWGAANVDQLRTAFAPGTVTLPELGRRVAALISDLRSHGIIGD